MTPIQLLSLAWRESRFARQRLLLFLSAISLGVAALVAVQGFASNLQREVRGQARAMLGADLRLMSREPFQSRTEAILDSLETAGVPLTRVTSFASMAVNPETGASRLVQVRAPTPGFPFYGTIETEPAGRWEMLHAGRNIIVEPALLVAIGANVGDSISVGATRFEVIGALQKLPGDIEVASSFAPRVFFPAAYLEETELLGFGARVEYEAFMAMPDPEEAAAFEARHEEVWRAERVRVRTLEEQQDRMEDALANLSGFLGIIGVFALLLGGIGVSSSMGAYMARKVEVVAVLRCLGATAGQVFGIYTVQAAVMGLFGAGIGVAIGAGVQWLLPELLTGLLPVDVRIQVDTIAIVTGLLVGVATAVAFAILPLIQVRNISPLTALRRRIERLGTARDPLRWAAWLGIAGGVVLLVCLQARELDVGLWISLGIAGTLLVLWLSARGITALVRRLGRTGTLAYTIRQGLANLHRPGNQTTTVVVALGFGVFLIATILLTRSNIIRPLAVDAESRGNLVLLDVQEDQVAEVQAILERAGAEVVQSAAIVPMRIAAVNGERVQPEPTFTGTGGTEVAEAARDDNDRPRGWAVRREYRSTFRDTVNASERVIAGRWWDVASADRAREEGHEVSLEEDIASELGVGLGDRIDWDVQGVRVPTVVTSIRQVDWARLEPNFFAVFEPAALAGAPQMWVFLARAEGAADRAAVQRDVVTTFPNVSVIDLTLVQRALDDVFDRVSLVIRFLAGFSVATGFIVLIGAVATGRLQRIRESVLLKTIGATRRQIGAILLTEYSLLGALAALIGIGLSIGAGWALARFLFDVPFGVEPLPLAALALTIGVLSAVLGLSASREVFRSTPMEAIREE